MRDRPAVHAPAPRPPRPARRASLACLLAAGTTLAMLSGCGSSKPPPAAPSAVAKLNAEGLRRLERGDAGSAEEMFREALREGELVDDLQGQAEAWNNLGALASSRGKADEAWAFHAAALRLHALRKVRDAGEVRTRINLGGAMLLSGKADEAGKQFREATALAESIGEPSSALMARVGEAAVALRSGEVGRAADLARDAAQRAGAAGDEGAVAAALSVEGAALEIGRDYAGARAAFEQALAIDRKREQPSAVEQDLTSLARLAERSGERAEAAQLLGRAARIARRMGRVDEAEQELRRALALADGDEALALRSELDALLKARAAR